jgi:hypothetical protein
VAIHLLELNDPNARDQAVAEIKASVRKSIEEAIMSKLAPWAVFTLDLDDSIGADTAIVDKLPAAGAQTPLSLAFGQQPGGQLLFYRDETRDGTGDIAGPAIIGQTGWQDFVFLFGGGNGIIYAVDNDGRLLFNFDQNQDGTGDVGAPAVIGLNGWQDYRFLFSGGNGIIYAVDQLIPASSRYEIAAHLELVAPGIELVPTQLDFGQVRIGESRDELLRISNTGLAPAAISVAASANGNFAWEPVETTLQPGTGIALDIEFTPHQVGTFRDAVTVTSAGESSTHTASLAGSAIKGPPPTASAS